MALSTVRIPFALTLREELSDPPIWVILWILAVAPFSMIVLPVPLEPTKKSRALTLDPLSLTVKVPLPTIGSPSPLTSPT